MKKKNKHPFFVKIFDLIFENKKKKIRENIEKGMELDKKLNRSRS